MQANIKGVKEEKILETLNGLLKNLFSNKRQFCGKSIPS